MMNNVENKEHPGGSTTENPLPYRCVALRAAQTERENIWGSDTFPGADNELHPRTE